MSKPLFENNQDICNLEEAAIVFPYAILALTHLIVTTYIHIVRRVEHGMFVAFICLLWGICFRDKHRNPSGIAKALGNISHDRLQRVWGNKGFTATILMLELFQQALSLVLATPTPMSWLILDDVLIPKPFAKVIQGAYWDHDHVLDSHCFGIRVVVLLWTNGSLSIPVAFLVWHKKQDPMPSFAPRRYRTKNELARIIVYWVVRKGLNFSVLVFDSWYASEGNLKLFCRLGILWVTALRCNRKIRLPLATPIKHRRGRPKTHEKLKCQKLASHYPKRKDYSNYPSLTLRARGFLVDLSTKLTDCKLVIVKDYIKSHTFQQELEFIPEKQRSKDPNKYLLTNWLDAPVAWVITCYQKRWMIECLFREAKQHFALCACQGRKIEAVTLHIAMSLFGYVCLQQLSIKIPIPVEAKDSLTLGDLRRLLQDCYLLKVGEQRCLIHLARNSDDMDEALSSLFPKTQDALSGDKVSSEPRHCHPLSSIASLFSA